MAAFSFKSSLITDVRRQRHLRLPGPSLAACADCHSDICLVSTEAHKPKKTRPAQAFCSREGEGEGNGECHYLVECQATRSVKLLEFQPTFCSSHVKDTSTMHALRLVFKLASTEFGDAPHQSPLARSRRSNITGFWINSKWIIAEFFVIFVISIIIFQVVVLAVEFLRKRWDSQQPQNKIDSSVVFCVLMKCSRCSVPSL